MNLTHSARKICTEIADNCQLMRTEDFFSRRKNSDRLLSVSTQLSALIFLLLVAISMIVLLIRSRPATNSTRNSQFSRPTRYIIPSLFILLVLCESMSGLLLLSSPLITLVTIPCWVAPFISDWLCFESDLLFILESSTRLYWMRYVFTQ